MQGVRQKIIVTRVPPALADEIERRAKSELMPVAAYVRRLLLLVTTADGVRLNDYSPPGRDLNFIRQAAEEFEDWKTSNFVEKGKR